MVGQHFTRVFAGDELVPRGGASGEAYIHCGFFAVLGPLLGEAVEFRVSDLSLVRNQ